METVKNSEFRPLTEENILKLLDVLWGFLPDSAVAYYSVKKQLDWSKQVPGLKFTVLCPDGDWRQGTMVQLTDGLAVPEKLYGTIYAREEQLGVLQACLQQTDLIEWDRLKQFTAVPKRCVPLLQSVLSNKGFTDITNFAATCTLNYMTPEEVNQVKASAIPDSVRIGNLEGRHLQLVCDNWGPYHPQFRPVVLKMIELNLSFGVFVKNDTDEEELVSWILESEYGGIGLLSTLPEHRRKGYAALLLELKTRRLGEMGSMPFSLNLTKNINSSSLFDRMGFRKGGLYQWVKLVKI